MYTKKIKILVLILVLAIFWSLNTYAIDLWDDIQYNEEDGSATVWDVSASDNNASVGDDINATDEESNVWNITWAWTETDFEWQKTEWWSIQNASTESSDEQVPSVTWVWYVEELPTTWPAEAILLIFSFLIAWFVFLRKRK